MKQFCSFISACLLAFALNAQNTITCDSIIQTSTCAGGNVVIPFAVTGSFPFGNVFTAQLSNGFGQFAAVPPVVGTTMFTIGGNGIIFGTIPANTNFGFLYRVRIVSSNPADTSSSSPNTLIVTQVAQLNTIYANPGDSACPGDTITLFAANPATSFSWSTGDTTQSIQVTSSGIYSVTTTDFLTCQSTTADTVVFDPAFCTGIAENFLDKQVSVFPNPANDRLNISFVDVYSLDAVLSIRDAFGKTLLEERETLHPHSVTQLDISGFAPGIYFLMFDSDGQHAVRKIVVK
ncbi:MAG TPA: T9SS type A sorting domain-containing protein [Bacteroidia bacterium]|nr:T9SS type A sorting domain-containing protein [Bacteroidia bacterium]